MSYTLWTFPYIAFIALSHRLCSGTLITRISRFSFQLLLAIHPQSLTHVVLGFLFHFSEARTCSSTKCSTIHCMSLRLVWCDSVMWCESCYWCDVIDAMYDVIWVMWYALMLCWVKWDVLWWLFDWCFDLVCDAMDVLWRLWCDLRGVLWLMRWRFAGRDVIYVACCVWVLCYVLWMMCLIWCDLSDLARCNVIDVT